MKRTHNPLALLLVTGVILSGCGGGAEVPKIAKNLYRGVYVSTKDCAADKNFSFDVCAQTIENAIQTHNKTSPSYPTLRACVATEGAGKCERDINQKFRPRLMAYLVETSTPPKATPLYPAPKGEGGFRDPAKVIHLENDLNLNFSKKALAAVNLHAKSNRKRTPF